MEPLTILAGAGRWLIFTRAGRALIGTLALVGLLWWAYATVLQRGDDQGAARVQGKFDKHLAADQVASDEAEAKARATEKAHRDANNAIAATYEQDKANAKAAADRTAADLRSGALRLRDEWAECETAALVSRTADAAARADDRARLRREGAANLVQFGEEADAHVRGLQAALKVCIGAAK